MSTAIGIYSLCRLCSLDVQQAHKQYIEGMWHEDVLVTDKRSVIHEPAFDSRVGVVFSYPLNHHWSLGLLPPPRPDLLGDLATSEA